VSPASPAVGLSLPIRAVGRDSDGTTQDLSAAAVWSSSAPAVATVDGGLVLGLALGTTTLTAETGGFSASFELPVMPPVVTAIEIGPLRHTGDVRGSAPG